MKRRLFMATGPALLAASGILSAQPRFPERAIRLVVPFAPGGDGDVMGRAWIKFAGPQSGFTFIVDNRAGAGGAIGAGEVARARADGYTLLLGTTTTQIINPIASAVSPYDPIKDFTLVGMVSVNPTCIVVNPGLAVNSLRELVALVKKNPGKYAYGSAGPGTITNLTGELFKYQAGRLDIQHIPYKGGGPAMQDLIAGHVPMITPIMSSAVLAQHRAGKARILAVNSAARLKAAPDIPTAMEEGVADMRVQVFNAIFAPAGTPESVLDALKSVARKVMADPSFVQDVERAGAEILALDDPDKFLSEEVARWTEVIKLTGFKAS